MLSAGVKPTSNPVRDARRGREKTIPMPWCPKQCDSKARQGSRKFGRGDTLINLLCLISLIIDTTFVAWPRNGMLKGDTLGPKIEADHIVLLVFIIYEKNNGCRIII